MKPYFLPVLGVLFFSAPVFAQRAAVRDTAKIKINYNGIHGTDYISLARGTYANSSVPHFALTMALMAEYRHNHFYANLGLGGCLTTADFPEANLFGSPTRMSKFLVELPAGIGFINTSKNHTTIQFGIDVPYVTEIKLNDAERGFAIAPRFTITWDIRKKKRAVGLMAHGLFNLQQHNSELYNPAFFGIGLFGRYY